MTNATGPNGTSHGDLPVRITHSTFKGKLYIDLRVWFVDETGDYQPSRSGVSIRPDHLAQVVQGLMLAARGIDPNGVS